MKLVNAFDELLSTMRPHFKQDRTFERARDLAYASLFTYGRHTITRLICSKNEQLLDWSADYKFYSLRRWEASDLFFEILKASLIAIGLATPSSSLWTTPPDERPARKFLVSLPCVIPCRCPIT